MADGALPERRVSSPTTARTSTVQLTTEHLTEKKTVHIKSYGCQMNAYDATRMADVLAPHGYETVDSPDRADLVILNTCHIREKASEKVYSELGRLRVEREERRADGRSDLTIAVAGCVAQAEGAEMLRRAPAIDLVLGPQTYHRLPEMLDRRARGERVVDTDFPADTKFEHLPKARTRGPAAFLTVQEGCDKFCSFCVVPYTRGAEYSRPVTEILAEARGLIADGVVELSLLGQNVNAFHGDGPDGKPWSLGRLIAELAGLDGVRRLRYTTSHPLEVDDELIAAHRDIPALMPYLHLPVQSGSDRVLAAMNRRHTADHFRRIVGRLREAQPALALSSDFIVGFPGETDADFAATMALVEETGFVEAYSFKYSPRPGTPAAGSDDQIAEAVKAERLAALQALLDRQRRAFNQATVGSIQPVLFDRAGRHDGQLVGRTPYLQPVHVLADGVGIGDISAVAIVAAHANSLEGRLAEAREAA